jgi:hypothetical protein
MVVVAPHGENRRKLSQGVENLGRADVAGVHDMLTAFQCIEHLGTQQSMGIRNEADWIRFDAELNFALDNALRSHAWAMWKNRPVSTAQAHVIPILGDASWTGCQAALGA